MFEQFECSCCGCNKSFYFPHVTAAITSFASPPVRKEKGNNHVGFFFANCAFFEQFVNVTQPSHNHTIMLYNHPLMEIRHPLSHQSLPLFLTFFCSLSFALLSKTSTALHPNPHLKSLTLPICWLSLEYETSRLLVIVTTCYAGAISYVMQPFVGCISLCHACNPHWSLKERTEDFCPRNLLENAHIFKRQTFLIEILRMKYLFGTTSISKIKRVKSKKKKIFCDHRAKKLKILYRGSSL